MDQCEPWQKRHVPTLCKGGRSGRGCACVSEGEGEQGRGGARREGRVGGAGRRGGPTHACCARLARCALLALLARAGQLQKHVLLGVLGELCILLRRVHGSGAEFNEVLAALAHRGRNARAQGHHTVAPRHLLYLPSGSVAVGGVRLDGRLGRGRGGQQNHLLARGGEGHLRALGRRASARQHVLPPALAREGSCNRGARHGY